MTLVEKYETEWVEAKRKLDSYVANAVATKQHLPDNYWHDEHEARRKLFLAREILE